MHAAGALFQVGDGHAWQGNGEVDITALETSLTGAFQFILHKRELSPYPRAETPTHYIAMGFDDDLSNATRKALRNMIDFLVARKGMTRDDAYMLISVAGDVEITELVDRNKGVHVTLAKSLFTDRRGIPRDAARTIIPSCSARHGGRWPEARLLEFAQDQGSFVPSPAILPPRSTLRYRPHARARWHRFPS